MFISEKPSRYKWESDADSTGLLLRMRGSRKYGLPSCLGLVSITNRMVVSQNNALSVPANVVLMNILRRDSWSLRYTFMNSMPRTVISPSIPGAYHRMARIPPLADSFLKQDLNVESSDEDIIRILEMAQFWNSALHLTCTGRWIATLFWLLQEILGTLCY